MIKFILALMLISGTAYAQNVEKIAVDRPDGSVSIVSYIVGSQDSLADVLKDSGLSGLPNSKVDSLPKREDRDYWVKVGNQVTTDSAKKAQKEIEKAQKKAEKDQIIAKLKITNEEWKKISDLEK